MTLFSENLDFVLLACGTMLAMLGFAATGLARLDRRLEWHWLATFAYLRAAGPWIDMTTVQGLARRPMHELIGSFCNLFAGIALLEFARQVGERGRGQHTGRWIHVVVLGASLPFAYSLRMDPLRNAGAVATLIGGLCAAAALYRGRDQAEEEPLPTLRTFAAASTALFGLTTCLADLWATGEQAAGTPTAFSPVWLTCGVTVVLAAAYAAFYARLQYEHLSRRLRSEWAGRAWLSLGVISAVIAGGLLTAHVLDVSRLSVLLITLLVVLLLLVSYQAQEKIRDQMYQVALTEQRSRLLVDSSPNATLLFDNEGRCVLANRSARVVFGLTEAETLERPFVELWPEVSRQGVDDAVRTSLGGTPSRFDAEYHHRDGRKVTLSVATNPALDPDGVVRGFVAVAADVTVRRRNEIALLSAKSAAESAAQSKSEFLAVMTHEIRTPLGGVIGLLESLKKMPQPPNQRRQTELALDSADSLVEILDHILDAAKIESSQFSLEPKPFNPATELARVTEGQRIRAENANLELHTHFSPDLPKALIGDATRLRQILTNLLSNAVKFTRQGHISVRVGGEAHPGRTHLLRIEVSDTGIGIRPEVQAKLFGQRAPGEISQSRHFGSTGLGLAIVRTIVDLMGGEIRVASQPDQGTTITVEAVLPLAEAAPAPAPRESVGSAPPVDTEVSATTPLPIAPAPMTVEVGSLKILCAEDNPTNRLILQLLLEPMGHEVHFAEDGKQAVLRLTEETFDVVLMDNRMPVMDGFQATRAIRDPNSEVLQHDIPVIALTANASKSYRDQCIESGMNDYLTKPVREPALRAALARALRQRPRVERTPAPFSTAKSSAPFTQTRPPVPAPAPAMVSPPAEPAGLTEEQLLALLDDAEQTAGQADPAAGLSNEARLRVSQQFLQETPRLLNSMRVAWAVRDAVTLGRAGHSLKSSARYVRAERLSEMGGKIESLADRGELKEVAPLIEQTDHEFAMVTERLLVESQA